MTTSRTAELLGALTAYRTGRRALLHALGCPASNRDPLAEFSEHLVAALLGGQLASSRVQKGFDLTTPDGARVQVRYLANPAGSWPNEHVIDFRGDCDRYALVTFEDLRPQAVLVFARETIEEVCRLLGKRHPDQDTCLQLTRRNFTRLLEEPARLGNSGSRSSIFGQKSRDERAGAAVGPWVGPGPFSNAGRSRARWPAAPACPALSVWARRVWPRPLYSLGGAPDGHRGVLVVLLEHGNELRACAEVRQVVAQGAPA